MQHRVVGMKIAKYFFKCPKCGKQYFDKYASGKAIFKEKGRETDGKYHFLICASCWNGFVRLTQGGKFIKNILETKQTEQMAYKNFDHHLQL